MKEIMPVMGKEEIKRIVMIQALAKDDREFLARYEMDDGVESCKVVAKAQNKADKKWMVEWLASHLDCPIRGLDEILKYQYHIPKEEIKAIKEALR